MQRDGIEVTFDKLTGLKLEKEKAGATETTEQKTEVKEVNEPEDNKESEEEDGNQEIEELDEVEIEKPATVCLDGMTKEEKKAHKKAVKLANAEKRQNKVPKAVKK